MINTLNELKSGKLIGSRRLKLACGLTEFPSEIISLASTLEILDLSGNKLSALPDSIAELKQLKIIFFANNKFTVFPKILAKCPALTMIGFKSNQIHNVPENAFPPLLQWLILTDNKLKKLPKSIGKSHLLQKCALAGNLIEELPAELSNCIHLELLRISANQLQEIPEWLFELPKLSWLAFAGNPGADKLELETDLELFAWSDFDLQELLGEGASGLISKAAWISQHKEVAIKVFKGAVTSDGSPEDEMAVSILAGAHENLVDVIGEIKNHPDGKSGLIMGLIPSSFINLGHPPNFNTCTRDVFDEAITFTEEQLLKLARSIASVSAQLHRKGINHGDLYAHNILVNESADCLLGDFGAATYYDVSSVLAHNIERVEVRAFGCLVEDLLGVVTESNRQNASFEKWLKLIHKCSVPVVKNRLSFTEIVDELAGF
tara:strand:+ start:1060 stop:2361 length:1302 start_codon:yes stop_codon:yes gene_type:complete